MHLKKSGKVTILHFSMRLEQINSYLGRLPGLVDSPKANKATNQTKPMDEAELAQLLLQTCPTKWQDQYSLIQGNIPQDLCSLLKVLETIEKCQEPTNSGKAYAKSEEKDCEKRKVSFKKEECILKKARPLTKMCILCKEH